VPDEALKRSATWRVSGLQRYEQITDVETIERTLQSNTERSLTI